ncbi:hypothetical protein BSM4216_2756 [Bacillus smithii]|nr:hypothetical protein BSM4216_2756 [Bacillus smithii]
MQEKRSGRLVAGLLFLLEIVFLLLNQNCYSHIKIDCPGEGETIF